MTPLLEVEYFVVDFGRVRALDGVSFRLPEGPYGLGLVGESGSGKTTIARALMRLIGATSGAIRLEGGTSWATASAFRSTVEMRGGTRHPEPSERRRQ